MNGLQKMAVYLKMSVKATVYRPSFQTIKGVIKYFPMWWKNLASGKNSVSDKMPWMSFEAISFIKKIVKPQMSVFEYGSGGSTLFWAAYVNKVVSIEHEKLWYLKMVNEFADRKINNVEYVLAEPRDDVSAISRNFSNPKDFVSADPRFPKQSFEEYVRQIDRFPDQSFDIIVVDGRARPSCILKSFRKLKEWGYLIVDNTERSYYLAPFNFNKREWNIWKFYGPVPYDYNFSETTILQKLKS